MQLSLLREFRVKHLVSGASLGAGESKVAHDVVTCESARDAALEKLVA